VGDQQSVELADREGLADDLQEIDERVAELLARQYYLDVAGIDRVVDADPATAQILATHAGAGIDDLSGAEERTLAPLEPFDCVEPVMGCRTQTGIGVDQRRLGLPLELDHASAQGTHGPEQGRITQEGLGAVPVLVEHAPSFHAGCDTQHGWGTKSRMSRLVVGQPDFDGEGGALHQLEGTADVAGVDQVGQDRAQGLEPVGLVVDDDGGHRHLQ
jgi:hypothetical protein